MRLREENRRDGVIDILIGGNGRFQCGSCSHFLGQVVPVSYGTGKGALPVVNLAAEHRTGKWVGSQVSRAQDRNVGG